MTEKLFINGYSPAFNLKYSLVLIAYFLLSFIGILHHEIWLDEAHHFLLARDSGSIAELYDNARYDGHPLLWNILLWIITRFSHDPFYMQLLHIFISASAVFVFLKYAPFNDLMKILFVFGYFMMYEYNIISRNYSISVLMLFAACSLMQGKLVVKLNDSARQVVPRVKRNYILILVALLLLSYTHLFSLICACALFAATVYFYITDQVKSLSPKCFITLSLLFLIISALILYSIVPPEDHFLNNYNAEPYLSFKRIGKAFSVFFKGFFHFPDVVKYSFWNTNLFVDMSKGGSAVLSGLCMVIPFVLFYNKPVSLFVFYFSSLLIALFIFFSPIIAGVRYFGFVFIMLIVSLWLLQIAPERKLFFTAATSEMIIFWQKRITVPFLYAILLVQFLSAVAVYALDCSRPFSEGKASVAYVKENCWQSKVVAVSPLNASAPVSAYLGKKVFYPETGRMESFCRWNTQKFFIDRSSLVSRLESLEEPEFILVINEPFSPSEKNTSNEMVFENDNLRIFCLTKFDKSIIMNENFRIYRAVKNNQCISFGRFYSWFKWV